MPARLPVWSGICRMKGPQILPAIARALNELGTLTQRRGEWHPSSVRNSPIGLGTPISWSVEPSVDLRQNLAALI